MHVTAYCAMSTCLKTQKKNIYIYIHHNQVVTERCCSWEINQSALDFKHLHYYIYFFKCGNKALKIISSCFSLSFLTSFVRPSSLIVGLTEDVSEN